VDKKPNTNAFEAEAKIAFFTVEQRRDIKNKVTKKNVASNFHAAMQKLEWRLAQEPRPVPPRSVSDVTDRATKLRSALKNVRNLIASDERDSRGNGLVISERTNLLTSTVAMEAVTPDEWQAFKKLLPIVESAAQEVLESLDGLQSPTNEPPCQVMALSFVDYFLTAVGVAFSDRLNGAGDIVMRAVFVQWAIVKPDGVAPDPRRGIKRYLNAKKNPKNAEPKLTRKSKMQVGKKYYSAALGTVTPKKRTRLQK
jgi:hypothetical protein